MPRPHSKWILVSVSILFAGVTGAVVYNRHFSNEDGQRAPAAVNELRFMDVERHADPRSTAREASDRTGIKVLKARKVHYESDPLRAAYWPGGRRIVFWLFDDAKLTIEFRVPSPQRNRDGEFVGQVLGDSESSVQIRSTDRRITGEIFAHGRTFRFVPDTGDIHFIIEVDPKSL